MRWIAVAVVLFTAGMLTGMHWTESQLEYEDSIESWDVERQVENHLRSDYGSPDHVECGGYYELLNGDERGGYKCVAHRSRRGTYSAVVACYGEQGGEKTCNTVEIA